MMREDMENKMKMKKIDLYDVVKQEVYSIDEVMHIGMSDF